MAQISFSGSPDICQGDPVKFSVASSAASAYNWTFGNGSSSTQINPVLIYNTSGSYWVKVNVKLIAGGTFTDSTQVYVRSLPKAQLLMTKSEPCSNRNRICFKDISTLGAPGQDITSAILLWGDGTADSAQSVAGKTYCTTYKNIANYKINYEVTDTYGCKSVTTSNFIVKQGISSKLDVKTSYPTCTTSKVCFSNNTMAPAGYNVNYKWNFNGTSSTGVYPSTSPYCKVITKPTPYLVSLIVTLNNGCSDTFIKNLNIRPGITDEMQFEDTQICFNESARFWAIDKSGETIRWFVDGKFVRGGNGVDISPIKMDLKEGVHRLRMFVYKSPTCDTNIYQNFYVNGPIANAQVANGTQCFTDRKVFFVGDDSLKYSANRIYKWVIKDPNGDSCIADRKGGVNLNKNCNQSTDWYHKHVFAKKTNGYQIRYSVEDTVSGCKDSTLFLVNLAECGSFNRACVGGTFVLRLCQNTQLGQLPADEAYGDEPIKVTLDSGRTWLDYPLYIDTSYLGTYDLGFIYTFENPLIATDLGADSIHIINKTETRYDTFLNAANLEVSPIIQDSLFLHIDRTCDQITISSFLENGLFSAGDSLKIKLFDNKKSTFIDSFILSKNSPFSFDSVQFIIRKYGFSGSVKAELISAGNCAKSYSAAVKTGFEPLLHISGSKCLGNALLNSFQIWDFENEVVWPDSFTSDSTQWFINDTLKGRKKNNLEHTFKQVGWHHIRILTHDSLGCQIELEDSVIIQDVNADITNASRTLICNNFKRFYDSSSLVFPYANDYIKSYLWSFSDGNKNSTEKNPFMALNFTKDSALYIKHQVTSASGCMDSIELEINLLHSNASFNLLDSVGCTPFKAQFINSSFNGSEFIWELGDQNNTIQTSSASEDTVNFTYLEPGKYNIWLTAVDSFYNPSTSSIYYCKSRFPESGDTIRLTVLPSHQTTILSKDTICKGEHISFNSNTYAPLFYADSWTFNQQNGLRSNPGDTVSYQFNNRGTYDVNLYPSALKLNPNHPSCFNIAHKKIHVLGIKADFDFAPINAPPLYQFNNKTDDLTATFHWDFGQPSSGNFNYSNLIHPGHNFGNDSSTLTICLMGTNSFGCADTICKPLNNDYRELLKLFNTFTPNADGFNDEFDVYIKNEVKYHLEVFNRYGNKVFDGLKDADNGQNLNWNGNLHNTGTACAEGTYYYTFSFSFKSNPNDIKVRYGTVSLIR